MQELKALLEALDDTHLRQAFQIMKKYDTSKMNIQTTDSKYHRRCRRVVATHDI